MNLTSVPAPLKAGSNFAGLLLAALPGLAVPLPGDLDPGFELDPALPPATETLAAAAHPDGRLLAVFEFAAGPELVAFKGDGSLDPSFQRRSLPGFVSRQLNVLPDGKILAAYRPDGGPAGTRQLARLMPDGRTDSQFGVTIPAPSITCVVPMPDGSVMLGGANGAGTPVNDLLRRQNPNGEFDGSFALTGVFNRWGGATEVAPAGDGYLVNALTGVYRLGPGGAKDDSFSLLEFDFAAPVRVLPLAGGDFLAAGRLLSAGGGVYRAHRFKPDGSVDAGFRPVPLEGAIGAMHRQADSGVLLAGAFTQVDGLVRIGLARLLPGGTVDASFVATLDTVVPAPLGTVDVRVHGLGELAGGRIFVAGKFVGAKGRALPQPLAVFAPVVPPARPTIVSLPATVTVTEGHSLDLMPRVFVPPDATFAWKRDGVTLGTQPELHRRNVQLRDGGMLEFVVTSPGGSVSQTVTVTVAGGPSHPGSADVTFDAGEGATLNSVWPLVPGVSSVQRPPFALAQGADGRTFLAANFDRFDGADRSQLVALLSDGRLDPTFNFDPVLSQYFVKRVAKVAVQADGRIIAAVLLDRSKFGRTVSSTDVIRLEADGTLDSGFSGDAVRTGGADFGGLGIDVQGRIVVLRDRAPVLRRLLPNGSVDPSFTAPAFTRNGASRIPTSLAVLADGRVILGGDFGTVGGVDRNGVVRLLTDGSVDPTFQPPGDLALKVSAVAPLLDGRLMVGETPAAFNAPVARGLVRLLADGSLDPSFSADGILTNGVARLAVDAFSRTVALPYARSGGETAENVVVRLRLDGDPDPDFVLNVGRTIFHGSGTALLVQNDSQIVVAGDLWQPEGLRRSTVIRLNGSDERRVKPFRLADGRPVLRLNSRAGRTYRVERSLQLNPAQWTEVNRLPGTGGVVDWTGAEAEADGFYRVLSE